MNRFILTLLAGLFGLIGGYLIYASIHATQTGRLVPKSPEYPVELATQPVLFWMLVVTVAAAGAGSLFAGWIMIRELWQTRQA